VQSCVAVGFTQFGFASLVTVIEPKNRVSMAVAQRIGMHCVAYDAYSQSDIDVLKAP